MLSITVTFGDALALVGIALAIALYALQVAHSRRRDLEAARAVLHGVEHGMVRGWGEWFFSTVYTDEGAKQRAFQEAENVQRRGYGQVFLVPTESLASLVNSPAAGDLIDTAAVEAASLALYWVGVFNQLVQQQTDFNARHLAEIRDETLSAERRDALASAAFSISHMIHGSGVASANAEDGWYRNLCDRVEANIRELDERARRPWWWQRWVALALTLLAASLAMAVWTFFDEDDAQASSKPASTQMGRAAGPPSGLTQSARTLWQFEALLYDTFHTRQVSAHYSRAERLGTSSAQDQTARHSPTGASTSSASEMHHARRSTCRRRASPPARLRAALNASGSDTRRTRRLTPTVGAGSETTTARFLAQSCRANSRGAYPSDTAVMKNARFAGMIEPRMGLLRAPVLAVV